MRSACLVLALLVACSRKPQEAPPDETFGGAPPAAPGAQPAAPTGSGEATPAGAASIVQAYEALVTDACARCKDLACFKTQNEQAATVLAGLERTPPSAGERSAIDGLTARLNTCASALYAPGGLEAFEQLADAACACADPTCLQQLKSERQAAANFVPAETATPEERARHQAAVDKLKRCAPEGLLMRSGDVVAAFQAVADEVCACKDLDCLQRATQHGDEVLKRTAGVRGSDADNAAVQAAGNRVQACATALRQANP